MSKPEGKMPIKKPNSNNSKNKFLNIPPRGIITLLLVAVGIFLLFNITSKFEKQNAVTFSDFIRLANESSIQEAVIHNEKVTFITNEQAKLETTIPFYYKKDLGDLLFKNGARFKYVSSNQSNIFLTLLSTWFPVLLIVGVWIFIFKQMQGGGGKLINMKQSFITQIDKNKIQTTFQDVAGIDEAKTEVMDIVDFLKNSQQYARIGGKIPKGILLSGSPGTGKTLLAKAIAGEANASFFSISGSDFVEMFVGVGSSRVRDLFNKARSSKPAIIFIDEIDSIGRHRGSGLGGGNDEREQTLNQLLVEMDGFSNQEGIIIIAATNRPDVLDSALTRPGRFDRQVVVPLPDLEGRKKILQIHTKKVKLAKNLDLQIIAGSTAGMAGANIANLVNEAALIAAKRKKTVVGQEEFDAAFEKNCYGTCSKKYEVIRRRKENNSIARSGTCLSSRS